MEVISKLEAAGWYQVAQKGSHKQFRYPERRGRVTVSHPKKQQGRQNAMAEYIALLWKEDASDYGVSFPNFPGCVTAGSSLHEARQLAAEALQFHIEGMLEDGEELPDPTALDEIMEDPENKEAVVLLVPVQTGRQKAVRVNVTFQSDLLEQIDKYADQRHQSRSAFLAEAAAAKITDQ